MLKVYLICCVCFLVSVNGAPQPLLNWDFNHNASNHYINETNSNGENRGLLLPGTSIIKGNSSGKVIYFSGNNSGLIIADITSDCFVNPWQCRSGPSLSFWINPLQWNNNSIILASANVNIRFTANDTLTITLCNGSHQWDLQYKPRGHVWNCYTVTWNTTTLSFYVAGRLQGETSNITIKGDLEYRVSDRSLLLGTAEGNAGTKAKMKMYIDNLKIWNDTLKSGDIYTACGIGGGSWGGRAYKVKYFSQVFTSLDYTDKALVGHTFKSFTVANLDQCIQHCKDNKNDCKSLNYEKSDGLSLCELNNIEAANSKVFITERMNFQFYDIYWTDQIP